LYDFSRIEIVDEVTKIEFVEENLIVDFIDNPIIVEVSNLDDAELVED
jgi:hypothetical protein